ncbi:hypothetical protein [uncultured Bacteroides sp.]|jgi:long-chain fatty acid transport protein|uniref:OmpP1/FadL family transporter n=1 Tax=uncultured Bacteroides sp. TaxID=162156 RepID=UPI0025D48204|nr:hypothetical protein [uncultured Bacteroides sp.]
MRKISLIGLVMLIVSIPTFAGDYLTNTNQHATYLRMVARGASIDVDGVYYNPAGLAFLPKDGVQLSLTVQSAFQKRMIDATSSLWTMDGKNSTRNYEGKASAPVIPSFHGVWKTGKWAVSGAFSITGGGGKASFDRGLPMFDAGAIGMVTKESMGRLKPSMYNINSAMEGRQYIFGAQLGLSRKINDHIAVYVGARMNYFTGGYKGFLNISLKDGVADKLVQDMIGQLVQGGIPLEQAQQVVSQKAGEMMKKLDDSKIDLDCDQTGWGLTPILGVDVKFGKLNLAAKYEFKANMNIENDTRTLNYPQGAEPFMAPFKDGVNTPSDIPAFFSVAAGYEFLPCLRASVEYHFFDDKHAGMAGGKENYLKHGTHEYLAGVEWDIDKFMTVSGGFQKTNYGLSDEFQGDTSFSCDSYSLGFGARLNLTKALSVDVAYFWSKYSDYTKEQPRKDMLVSMKQPVDGDQDVYGRTNKVFGVSVNYKF